MSRDVRHQQRSIEQKQRNTCGGICRSRCSRCASPERKGQSVLRGANRAFRDRSRTASVEQSASVGSPGPGWSGKGKGLQVSKLHGRVKSMALVEGPSKSNTSLQRANPTYRPFPDARPAANEGGKFWPVQFTETLRCGAFQVHGWQMCRDCC